MAGSTGAIIDTAEDAAHSTLDREDMDDLWAATFSETDTHYELCRPCTEAVLDAALAEWGTGLARLILQCWSIRAILGSTLA